MAETPQQEPIEVRVRRIIAEHFQTHPDSMQMDTNIVQEFGADSLDCVELLMEFEDEFDIHIPDEEAVRLHTVQQVIYYLKSITS